MIEAMRFIMDLGKTLNRLSIIEKVKKFSQCQLRMDRGIWGKVYYFMDCNGCPPNNRGGLEPGRNIETAIFNVGKAIKSTGDQTMSQMVEKVHDVIIGATFFLLIPTTGMVWYTFKPEEVKCYSKFKEKERKCLGSWYGDASLLEGMGCKIWR